MLLVLIPSIPLLSFIASIHYLYIKLLVLDCYLSRMFFFSCCFSTEILSLCPSLIPSCFLHLFLHFFIFTLYVNVTLLLIHLFPSMSISYFVHSLLSFRLGCCYVYRRSRGVRCSAVFSRFTLVSITAAITTAKLRVTSSEDCRECR